MSKCNGNCKDCKKGKQKGDMGSDGRKNAGVYKINDFRWFKIDRDRDKNKGHGVD